MRILHIRFSIAALVATSAACLWLAISGKRCSNAFPTSETRNVVVGSNKELPEPATNSTRGNEPRPRVSGHAKGNAQYYRRFGSNAHPIELERGIVIDRIDKGLKILQRGTIRTSDREILSIDDAYHQLTHNEVFMELPSWGIEMDQYFVFSGDRDCDVQMAFSYGYAVRKDDGQIFRWWLPKDE